MKRIDSFPAGGNVDDEIALEQAASYKAPEIIKLRKKRSLSFRNGFNTLRPDDPENESTPTFASQTVTPKIYFSITTQNSSDQTIKPTTSSQDSNSHYEEKKEQEKQHETKQEQNPTKKPQAPNRRRTYELVTRGPESISFYQWYFIRKSLLREKEKEEGEEEEEEREELEEEEERGERQEEEEREEREEEEREEEEEEAER